MSGGLPSPFGPSPFPGRPSYTRPFGVPGGHRGGLGAELDPFGCGGRE